MLIIISGDCTSIANCFVFLLFSNTLGDLNNTRPAPPSPWKRCGRANSIHLRYLVRLFSVCRKCPNEEESLSSTEAPALHPNKNGNNWKITSARERQQLCTCSTLFCTFLYRHCMTTTWKCLNSRLSRTGTQNNNFLFLFLNFDTVL